MINKGNITPEQIAELKQAFPGEALFKWPSPDKKDDVIFRAITYDLLQKILSIVREAELQGRGLPVQEVNEKIFDACVVWPKFTVDEKLALPVGIIPSIVKVIQEKSGFIDVDIMQRILAPDTITTIIRDFDYWGDIDEEEADKLRESCKPFALFRVRIGRWVFAIRPMTRIDIQVASQSTDDQLALAKAVTMWPKDVKWDTVPAGIIDILGRKANEVSGWEPDSQVEEL